jgi:hypothetical protein
MAPPKAGLPAWRVFRNEKPGKKPGEQNQVETRQFFCQYHLNNFSKIPTPYLVVLPAQPLKC